MAWVPSHQGLRDHPKVRKAASMLGVPRVQVIGHLHCLWWWALSYAPDGDVSRYDNDDLAMAAEWEGDPNKLVTALLECGPGEHRGFLDPDRQLHDWYDYAGRYEAKKAAADGVRGNHIRWHEKRGVIDPTCPICSPDDRPESGGESGATSPRIGGRIADKRRGEDKEPSSPPPASASAGFLDWYAGYPRKVGRKEAEAAYTKAVKAGATCEQLTASLAQWRTQWLQENRPVDKIPHPATWLNKERWRDELKPTGTDISYDTPPTRYV